ncbi:MAG: prolipoprotein diacylglyceryl transferase [Candidatus Omnitrophota bacterium]|nr:prolipoprotein diacylglyceryl transferase [Candidatus Omnitrophota bacterium]MBU1894309.1 prolipoprotein diacylglyceryl transferase [Candidatus Omnitrophota bacterium]
MHRVFLQIGPCTFYSYGLCVAIGFLVSAFFLLRSVDKCSDISRGTILDCFITLLISGLIGGRLLYVFINWEYYLRFPFRILMFHEGGLAFQGALITAVFSGIVFCGIKKISFWKMSDLIVPYIALGQAFGRIGCFLNGCCYGGIVQSGCRVTFPGEDVCRIPVQLYSSMILFLICMLLLKLRQKDFFQGVIFALYLVLYGAFRFFIDFLRGDNLVLICGIKLSQIIGAGTFLIGLLLFFVLKYKKSKERVKLITK